MGANCTSITTVHDPIDPLSPRSEPAPTQHVGSISTALGALRRRRDPQCHLQDSFGTTPARLARPTAPASYTGDFCSPCGRGGGAGPSIDSMADELDDIARGLDIERSNRFSEEQRPPHWRHRVCARLDRLVLADVWPRCRRRDHGRGRVSGAPPPAMDGHLGELSGSEHGLT
jgi:hypothetical protein